MGAEDAALVEEAVQAGVGGAGRTLGQRPLGGAIVLRLHCAQPADRIDRRCEGVAQQPLRAKSARCDLGHDVRFCRS